MEPEARSPRKAARAQPRPPEAARRAEPSRGRPSGGRTGTKRPSRAEPTARSPEPRRAEAARSAEPRRAELEAAPAVLAGPGGRRPWGRRSPASDAARPGPAKLAPKAPPALPREGAESARAEPIGAERPRAPVLPRLGSRPLLSESARALSDRLIRPRPRLRGNSKRGATAASREQRRRWPKGRERPGAERLPGSGRTRWAGPGHDGGCAARERVPHGPVVGPPANAVLPQWGVLHPLLPGYAPDGHVQKSGFQLPSESPGARPGSAVPAGSSGSSSAVLGYQGQPDGGRGATGRQPGPHGDLRPAVCVLPALADPRAVGRLHPQHHAPDAAQPGGRPAGGGHRRLHQLSGRSPRPGQEPPGLLQREGVVCEHWWEPGGPSGHGHLRGFPTPAGSQRPHPVSSQEKQLPGVGGSRW